MLSQHYTKCSDKALPGVGVGCKVLQHGHIVQSRGGERVVRKQLKKELREKNRGKIILMIYFIYYLQGSSFGFTVNMRHFNVENKMDGTEC